MPTVTLTEQFYRARKTFTKRSRQKEDQLRQAFAYFSKNPKHPSLYLEKLSGQEMWTIRVDKGNRLFFIWSNEGDTAIFFYIGSHDAYKKLK